MDIALLNVKIIIQKNETVVDAIGNHKNTWTDFHTCFATVSGEGGSENNVDSQEIRIIFGFIQKITSELFPNRQVIVVDHADIKEDYFQDSIVEKWWDEGESLIPPSWVEH